jgi:hypothetical protein
MVTLTLTLLGKEIKPLGWFKEQNDPVWLVISSDFCPP